MADKMAAPLSRHACGGPKWGKLAEPGACARCDELRAGAPRRRCCYSIVDPPEEGGAA